MKPIGLAGNAARFQTFNINVFIIAGTTVIYETFNINVLIQLG